ncbi:outer membrane protein assembly factor BamA [Tropicimonas sp. S265A]|uniref:outer membrane protein assembly factor BamA n=1 Tax=Tropicimonas sp. S265A TaxID=3415134 RepID=UPI003C7AA65E
MALAQDFRFSQVEVNGNLRIDAATVLSFAQIPRDQPVSAGQLNDAFQRIQASGLFEEVEVLPRGNTLQINVREFPTINRVNIEGNRSLDDELLLQLVESGSREVYTPEQAVADAESITDAYRQAGRMSATVTPRIIRQSDNRVDLVFEVTEARVVENERISFVGNQVYSDRRLRRVLATKQAGFLRQFVRSDTFIEDRVEFDRQLLTDFYRSRGYVDFQVLSVAPQLSQERDAVFLTFNVREGQQFRFGEVTGTSELAAIDVAEYAAAIDIDAGEVYSPELVDRNIERMERVALENGENFIRVTPRVTRNDRAGTLDVEFVVERSPRVFVERIDIEGNATTLDRVIRRQFDTVEGDPFNPREIQRSADRIRALGFFESVDVDTRQGPTDDTVIVDVDVEEGSTGSLNFGGSYSVDDGIGLLISLVERNFLGRGQTVALNWNGTDGDQTLTARFIEPSFLERDLAFSASLGVTESDSSNRDFDVRDAGLDFGLSFPVSENGRLATTFGYSSTELSDLDPVQSSPILLREQGTDEGFELGYTYTYNTRGRGLDPTAGVRLRFGQSLEGIGGDNTFVRTEASILGERSFLSEDIILRGILEGGVLSSVSGDGPRTPSRFFLGSNRLRGFSSFGVGPRDLAAPNEDALGGNKYVSLRLETRFPLGLPEEYGIDFGVFWDTASVWDLNDTDGFNGVPVDDSLILRSSVGISVFWTTALGPLRFNFSEAIRKEDFDITNSFDLTLSTQF